MTTFLRFPDEARAIACMDGWYDPEAGWGPRQPGEEIDVIGPIDDEGFHLNVIGDVPAKAAPFLVTPSIPMRVFAQ